MFYGFYIVAGVFIAQMFMTGFMTYAFSLYVVPLQTEFGVGRTEIMLAPTLTTLIGLVASPVIGSMVDKFAARWLMSVGAIIFAAGLYSISHSTSLTVFLTLWAICISFSAQLLGPLTGSSTVSRWFTDKRGMALGIAALGTSFGGILVPMLTEHWLSTGDWRSALQNTSLVIAVVVLPYLVLVMRPSPVEAQPITPEAAASQWTLARLLKNRAFWSIGLCMGSLFAVYSALMANLVPYAEGLGQDTAAAARLIVVIAISGIVGKVSFGAAADRMSLRAGLALACALVIAGLLVLASQPSYTGMLIGAVLLGLAAGGMLPVWGALLAEVFGLLSYGKVMGLMGPMITILVMSSFPLAGYMYDATGNYQSCFWLFAGWLAIAMLLIAGAQPAVPTAEKSAD